MENETQKREQIIDCFLRNAMLKVEDRALDLLHSISMSELREVIKKGDLSTARDPTAVILSRIGKLHSKPSLESNKEQGGKSEAAPASSRGQVEGEESVDIDVIPCRHPASNTSVAVDNIGLEATEEEIQVLFAPFGLIQKVIITTGGTAGPNLRYAVVTYFSERSAVKAGDHMQGELIGGKPCMTRVMGLTGGSWDTCDKILSLGQAVIFMNYYLGFGGWANSVENLEFSKDEATVSAEAQVKLADGRKLRERATVKITPPMGQDDLKFATKTASTQALRRCLGRLVVVRASGVTDVIVFPGLPEDAELHSDAL